MAGAPDSCSSVAAMPVCSATSGRSVPRCVASRINTLNFPDRPAGREGLKDLRSRSKFFQPILIRSITMKTDNSNGSNWSLQNADIVSFQNGDAIPEAKTNEQWLAAFENKKPAWCSASDVSDDNKSHGNLYNWYAITDKRGFAPKGWILPSQEDLESLLSNQNGSKSELELLKVGLRSYVNGKRYSMDTAGYYWSRTSVASEFAKAFMFNEGDAVISHTHKGNGYSVRFIKGTIPKKVNSPASGGGLTQKTPKTQMSVGASVSLWFLLIFIVFLCLIIMII